MLGPKPAGAVHDFMIRQTFQSVQNLAHLTESSLSILKKVLSLEIDKSLPVLFALRTALMTARQGIPHKRYSFAGVFKDHHFKARSELPRTLATKARKYREMAANMTDPDDAQLILDFAAKLEELSKWECDISDCPSNQHLDPDRERVRCILNGAYATPAVSPLLLEIMFAEVLQKSR